MSPLLRQARKFIETEGLTVDSILHGGKHIKAVVRTPNGKQHTVCFPNTPSDPRSLLNKRAQLRKLHRENLQ